MLTLKTIVPKHGDISSYISKPVLDRMTCSTFESKVIGVISHAVEKEDGYELTIVLRNKMQYEWINSEVSTIALGISN